MAERKFHMKKFLKVRCTAVLTSICLLVLLLTPTTGVNAESESNTGSENDLITYTVFGDIDDDGTVDSLDYARFKDVLTG